MIDYIKSQFGHPRGLVGQVVGMILAAENRERIAWAVTAQANDTLIAGVDISKVMVAQSCRRNAAAIEHGRVQVLQGSVEALPCEDGSFDVAFAINSYHIWPDTTAALAEILRVLKPGGRFVIIEQPPEKIQSDVVMKARGMQIVGTLAEAGFKDLEPSYARLKRGWTAAVRGIKASDT